jgi:hypothetical protein
MIEGLGHLLVIDRLDVGPVELEDDKLTMPYAVTRKEDGAEITDATELVYKYQEPVFTKRADGTWDPIDVNLASLIGAQLALNYGLFCNEIRFRGPFDKNDRGFLRDMAANTAREIYVKKILEPNPFLTLGKHPTVRTRTYVQAELTFDGDDDPPSTTPWVRPEAERAIAVLSSGGKDSLLSTGLLEEIGQEVHPLFVNESGRHWFTALNGFRLMEDRHPERTARVWTNSDRVFPWMLKHIPFVRPDHQRLRSDEYPIRLWTVAVFLFGVLPLMKKRGLDRLVIGDEFDTTVRARHEGIPHWNGLFDQSRIFDATLTRFFHKKGWKVHQFSILRPMSELLIQRTLMKRYPDLFAAQVSCHATHTEGDRVRPCGRCEKCRRIVGMVLSEGGDPEACGYTPGQIEPALSDLAKHGAHQEKDGVRHLAWSLVKKGLISRETPLAKIAKQMPHVGATAVRLAGLSHLRHPAGSPRAALPDHARARRRRRPARGALVGVVRSVGAELARYALRVRARAPGSGRPDPVRSSDPPTGGAHVAPGTSATVRGRRRDPSRGRCRAARQAPAARRRHLGRRLPGRRGRQALLRAAAARVPGHSVRRELPPRRLRRDDLGVPRDAVARDLRDRDERGAERDPEARHPQRPRRQRSGAPVRGADDQPRRAHLHVRR